MVEKHRKRDGGWGVCEREGGEEKERGRDRDWEGGREKERVRDRDKERERERGVKGAEVGGEKARENETPEKILQQMHCVVSRKQT
jgi:hypothetical protein